MPNTVVADCLSVVIIAINVIGTTFKVIRSTYVRTQFLFRCEWMWATLIISTSISIECPTMTKKNSIRLRIRLTKHT